MNTPPDAPSFDPSEVTFVTRGVTHAEAAAVTAVLKGLLQEESQNLRAKPGHAANGWQQSQRSVRGPLAPGAGRWRGFSG
jgi:hypothetical protein